MSVLKNKRTTSKAEFVNTANEIYTETINFLSRLSARYSRLLADPAAKMAAEVVDKAEKVQSFFTSDEMRLDLRKQHLYKRKMDAGEMTVQQAEEQLQGHIAYYKNFNDHGRLLRLRRIYHAIFFGGAQCSKSPEMGKASA